jgi:hypothetical protein
MLVRGSLESRSSRTTSVWVSRVGSIRVNFIMCPGNHDGGIGNRGNGMRVSAMAALAVKKPRDELKGELEGRRRWWLRIRYC